MSQRFTLARIGITAFLVLACATAGAVPIAPGGGADGIRFDDGLGDGCTLLANGGQGQACDPDLNRDGRVNFLDLAIFRADWGTDSPRSDFNADGIVNFVDLAVLRYMFLNRPGPGYGPPPVRVSVAAPLLLAFAGALAWCAVRRRGGARSGAIA